MGKAAAIVSAVLVALLMLGTVTLILLVTELIAGIVRL